MYQLIERLKSLGRREEGQDLLEYALLIALIAIVCVGAITLAGANVRDTFNNIAGSISADGSHAPRSGAPPEREVRRPRRTGAYNRETPCNERGRS